MALLTDKVIFLTGGAQGIGKACASAYVREGARVIIADIDAETAQQAASELGDTVFAVRCDVRLRGDVDAAVKTTLERFGRLDAVHNNAGVSSPSKPLHETSERGWNALFATNLKSVYWTTRAAINALKVSKGCILNTASMVGLIGQDNHAAYVATKGGMIALTKAMALDYAPFGVRVNAICPAGVWTPLLRRWVSEQPDPSSMTQYLNTIHALGYCPEGDVIADAAAFLLSDLARFITGAVLPVSGGAELGYRR